MKKKAADTWEDTKKEMYIQKKRVLKKGFEAVFGGASTEKTTFDEQFPDHPNLKVDFIEGVWMDMPAGYYYCFLKYKANKKQLLRFIEQQPTKNPGISSTAYSESDKTELVESLQFLKENYPDAYQSIPFFHDVPQNKNLVYYSCNRYPKAHIIGFDPSTGIVYHHFQRYTD